MMWPVEAFIAYLMLYFVKVLTFRGARRFGAMIGSVILWIPSQKKLILANLKQAFPDKTDNERKKIACESVRGLAQSFIEFLWFYKSGKKFQKYIHAPDEVKEMYSAARDPDKPVIFLAMHWGNWELATYGFNKVDDEFKSCVIARKFKNPFIEKIILEGREFGGTKVLHEKGAARGIVKALKENTCVGMLVDQNTKTHQGGTYAKFFGLPATISKMPAKMARKLGTKVMIANCKRIRDGFEICLDVLPKEVDEYETEEELTQAMMTMMENFIKNAPEQWIWLYRRWNYIPKNWADRKDEFPYYAVIDERLEFDG